MFRLRRRAIATHEARHATDKSANEKFEPSKYKREELAGSDEKEYINEHIKKDDMRKICSILLLCTFGVIASPKEDIYRTVLMSLYQTELEYSYTKIYSGLETALSEHKWYQEYVVISDYSEMPAQGVSSDSFGKESAPY